MMNEREQSGRAKRSQRNIANKPTSQLQTNNSNAPKITWVHRSHHFRLTICTFIQTSTQSFTAQLRQLCARQTAIGANLTKVSMKLHFRSASSLLAFTSITTSSIFPTITFGSAAMTPSTTPAAASALTPATKSKDGTCNSPPNQFQPYSVVGKKQISPDSCVLEFALPNGREYLGYDAELPTCMGVEYNNPAEPDERILRKSYSPVSHPSQANTFDLLVKAYTPRPGGGVGDYLCNLEVGHSIMAIVKKPRQVHGSPVVEGRWKHVGLVGGGTGIAPLYQLLVILLEEETKEGQSPTKISVLSINRHAEDILMKPELDELARKYPDRVSVTYSLTGDKPDDMAALDNNSSQSDSPIQMAKGRGDVEMAKMALPKPGNGDGTTMVFVCGKDGFVSTWGGPVMRADPPPGAKKGPKIQGPLLGILKEAGFQASEVFKY